MRRILVLLLAVGVGVVLGRMFDGVTSTAEAGGDQGRGGAVLGNGDVNGDGSINIVDPVYLLNWIFLDGPEPEPCENGGGELSSLPGTGQTTCYDKNGNVIDCTSDTCAGQDGFYSTGCPSEGRFVDNGDGTVSDTCTGLMWQQDTADTNGDGVIELGPLSSDRRPWCEALAFCENLTFAGHDDWRLPNIRELQSIVDYGRGDLSRFIPSIDP